MTDRPEPTVPADYAAWPDPAEFAGAEVGYRRTEMTMSGEELTDAATRLLGFGYRLALVAGHDDGAILRIVYLFLAGHPDRRVELTVEVDAKRPRLTSLAQISFPAGRFERELVDLFGVELIGHPMLRRLVKHQHWPADWHPMRRDPGPAPELHDTGEPYPFAPVEGDGAYEIPVGPVHAGLIEPGHFRFWAVGETVLKLKARLWFTHKGVEKLFEGRNVTDATELAERISGDTSVGHALAYCRAVEDAAGITVSDDTLLRRSLLLEVERLHNHCADLGALCNDVGFGVVNAYALRLREQLMRLNARLTGHRLGRGGTFPGGAMLLDVPTVSELDALGEEIHELCDLALSNTIVNDRFTATSVLSRDDARDIGVLGYVARASGLDVDARRDQPADPYSATVVVTVLTGGDVMCRFRIRMAEIDASLQLLRKLIPLTATGRQMTPLPATAARASGVGIVEGWRGTIVHRVEVAAGMLSRVKVVDPSWFNWPALPVAIADTILPDFPLTNKSFNLSYAGNDL